MRLGHLGLGKRCLPLLLVLVSCGSPAVQLAQATPPDVARTTAAALFPTTQAVEETLLKEIAERICPHPDKPDRIDPYERYFSTGDRVYTFVCYPAAGHSITVSMRRFADPAEAQAQFESASALGPAEKLHSFPVSDWLEQHPSFPGGRYEYRVRLLQVGQWLIRVQSFDDTHFLIAPEPRDASYTILQVIQEHGLPSIPDQSP